MGIYRTEEAIVHGGQVVLSGLPVADGGRVQVVVTAPPPENGRAINEVRGLLRGAVERYDEPFEPVISPESWEMFK